VRTPGERPTAAGGALLAVAALGALGCSNQGEAPACGSSRYLLAVAPDAQQAGVIYVADSAPPVAGYPYAVEQADTLAPILMSTNDGSALALLAPAAGGVIVVNGGAAARRFGTSGLDLTIGYETSVGVSAALAAGDRLVTADLASVRLYETDGTRAWEVALPGSVDQIFQVVSDREDGVWVLGTFSANLLPLVPTSVTGSGSGPFILHLDGAGTVLGANGWSGSKAARDNQLVMTVDAGGAPVLVFRNRQGASPPVAGSYDRAAQPGGLQEIDDGVLLEADAAGNLLALSAQTGTLHIAHFDVTNGATGGNSFAFDAINAGALSVSAAPVAGGVLLTGERYGTAGPGDICPSTHFLVSVSTADLSVTKLPLGLP
jgi:hypothetical protein